MTPREFIDKWQEAELKERSAAQEHFIDLCHLLGEPTPADVDKTGETYAFEKGALKSGGGDGWADVWKKGCFAWEYKGKRKDLDKAYAQLQQYAVALENPPLLIVCDMDRFRIHTNWTNTVQQVHEFALADLEDAATRDLLKAAFSDPEKLKPAKTREMLTEEAAEKFADLALRLRKRGHDPQQVAHFVNRLVFCMFAEDVGLLPNSMFTRMLEHCREQPQDFEAHARTLFGAMRGGGMVGFERVEWFNGGLFDDDMALPLVRQDVREVYIAAKLDWSDIDPSILGTLFERGLDPDKRSQLGAHYTDRDKIMLIVTPVIIEPLSAEWEEVKARIEAALARAAKTKNAGTRTKAHNEAVALHVKFIEKLKQFRVLDPACGSGNFLYLSLRALKDIEHRVNLEAEALGLPRGFPSVGPESVFGIEINPYAAELARVSIWVGEIQWMRRNGFEASRNPVLRSLGNIQCRDAVLEIDAVTGKARPAVWPAADVVVGNPPFLGDKKMISELGEDYVLALRKAYEGRVKGGADLVTFWFSHAWQMVAAGKLQRVGLVATNSIRGGANREVLKPIVEHGRIFNAWSDESWTLDGAAVRVSLICFDADVQGPAWLDGRSRSKIFSDLSSGEIDFSLAMPLHENKGVAFIGTQKTGAFDVSGEIARSWLSLPSNPNGRRNVDVVRPWMNGKGITGRSSDTWIIDFGVGMKEIDAAYYEAPFTYLKENVYKGRQGKREGRASVRWWLMQRPRPEMRKALQGLERFIVTVRVSKHRFFVWLDKAVIPDTRLVVFARDDDTTMGVLHSRFHEVWSLKTCSWHGVGNDPTYNAESVFGTFPFPEGLTPDIPASNYADDPRAQAIAAAAKSLNDLREAWLNPPDLVVREPEVVPGYPDRILPKDDEAAKVLAKRTLTNLYNARPAWLAHAHAALDAAVAAAYGWPADIDDDDVLARLFALNQARAA